MLRLGTNEKQQAAILETTAYVAGWKVRGKSQLGYVKECGRRLVIGPRLIGAGGIEEESPIDSIMCCSERFHCITLKEPSWPIDTNYRSFQEQCDTFIDLKLMVHEKKTAIKQNLWKSFYKEYVSPVDILMEKVNSRSELHEDWRKANRRSTIIRNAMQKIGRDHICNLLNESFLNLDNLVMKFQEIVEPMITRFRLLGKYSEEENEEVYEDVETADTGILMQL
jgi:hypothetical protein